MVWLKIPVFVAMLAAYVSQIHSSISMATKTGILSLLLLWYKTWSWCWVSRSCCWVSWSYCWVSWCYSWVSWACCWVSWSCCWVSWFCCWVSQSCCWVTLILLLSYLDPVVELPWSCYWVSQSCWWISQSCSWVSLMSLCVCQFIVCNDPYINPIHCTFCLSVIWHVNQYTLILKPCSRCDLSEYTASSYLPQYLYLKSLQHWRKTELSYKLG